MLSMASRRKKEPKRMGTRQFRDDLSNRIDAAWARGEPTIITRNGKPRAVLISYEEWAARETPGAASDRP